MIATTLLGLNDSNAQTYQIIPSNCIEDLNEPITLEIQKARAMWLSLTGTVVPLCDDRLKRMEIYIRSGRVDKAADVAISDPLFYNVRVRDMAAKICTRDATLRTDINDCIATIVGATRDGLDIAEMITGNFYYMIDVNKVGVSRRNSINRNNVVNDMLRSNRHYEQIKNFQLSMFHVLKRVDGQQIVDLSDQSRARPAVDPAGIITSRAYMMAHAVAGTNRRLVEKTFQNFLCAPITEWADNTVSDRFVGRDVDRAPGADPQKYHITCKGCHAPMDSMRGAFARVNFDNNFYQYSLTSIQGKMNRARDTTPDLFFLVTDDSFDSQAIYGANSARFGFRGFTRGQGMNQYAQMLAESDAYGKCMVTQAFRTACGREPQRDEEKNLVLAIAQKLDRLDKRNLSYAFKQLAMRKECVGVEL